MARSGLQLDMYEHTVFQGKDLLCGWLFLTVWRLIISHPTRKTCFIQPPSGCKTENELFKSKQYMFKPHFRGKFVLSLYLCVPLSLYFATDIATNMFINLFHLNPTTVFL